eukprot:12286304-Alexandrium_andersonii.AAC.1
MRRQLLVVFLARACLLLIGARGVPAHIPRAKGVARLVAVCVGHIVVGAMFRFQFSSGADAQSCAMCGGFCVIRCC